MLSLGTHLFHYSTLLTFLSCVIFYDRLAAWAQGISSCAMFNISDVSIQKEIRLETVSSNSLLIVSFLMCALVLILTTLFEKQTVNMVSQGYHCWLNLRSILCNFFWMVLLMFLVKIKWGRLRPSFIEACGVKQDIMQGDSDVLLDSSVCTKTDFIYYCQSFFSGHTCVAWYTLTIVVGKLYQSNNIHCCAKVLFSLLTTMLACWVSWTRYSDHQHHLSDIMIGGCVGVTFAAPLVLAQLIKHVKTD